MLLHPIFANVTTVADPIAPAPMTAIGNCSLSGEQMSSCRQNLLDSMRYLLNTCTGCPQAPHVALPQCVLGQHVAVRQRQPTADTQWP